MKISVIMPVYNTEKYLKESIESILTQSFKDFEFIIIDDCSTDGCYKLLKEYSSKDNRIKLFKNKENMGISYTRTKLIELSNTNYIASQDSDDISENERLQLEFEFLENNSDYGVVSGNNIIIDEKNEIIGYRKYSNNFKKIILKKSPISQPSSMFRKDVFLKLGGYDIELNYGEDYDLWLRMFIKGYLIKNLNNNLIKYRLRNGQSKSDKLKETIKNTIYIQNKARVKYGYHFSISDWLYFIIENIILFFPNFLIIWLFINIEYKN